MKSIGAVAGFLLVLGGVGGSEIAGGSFWAGIGIALAGLVILWQTTRPAGRKI